MLEYHKVLLFMQMYREIKERKKTSLFFSNNNKAPLLFGAVESDTIMLGEAFIKPTKLIGSTLVDETILLT